jgi:hypothetical protein
MHRSSAANRCIMAPMRTLMVLRSALVALLGALCAACPAPASGTGQAGTVPDAITRSSRVQDKGLEIFFEIRPDVRMDRVPMRTAVLHFHNVSQAPVRIYLPRSEEFRAGLSTLAFRAGAGSFFVPEPRPHGIVIEEDDFPLIAPGEDKTFEQSFTLDPMQPGAGSRTARRPGFEDGKTVPVSWTYSNDIVRWAGGQQTLDGPTKTLFEGKDIPHIWTGKLSAEASWSVR